MSGKNKEDVARLFSVGITDRQWVQTEVHEFPLKCRKNLYDLWEWSNTGTDYLERLQSTSSGITESHWDTVLGNWLWAVLLQQVAGPDDLQRPLFQLRLFCDSEHWHYALFWTNISSNCPLLPRQEHPFISLLFLATGSVHFPFCFIFQVYSTACFHSCFLLKVLAYGSFFSIIEPDLFWISPNPYSPEVFW